MDKKYIQIEVRDRAGIVTIDRPPVNSLNSELMVELRSVFSEFSNDSSLRVIVLGGAGEKAFVAGADISEVKDIGEQEGRKFSELGQSMTRAIEDCPLPVICVLNGSALGGGCEVALACDIRIMAEDAVIGLPEASLGIIPGAGGTQRLPRMIPPGMAKKLLFSARPISSAEALRCGLVEAVVKKDLVMETALKLAEDIASNGPLAVKGIKFLVRRSMELKMEKGLDLERQEFGKLCGSEDKHEGIKAFFEKRKAIYAGQ